MLSTATQYTRDAAEVGNIGHFDNEMDMAGLETFPGIKIDNIKPQAPPAASSSILRGSGIALKRLARTFRRADQIDPAERKKVQRHVLWRHF